MPMPLGSRQPKWMTRLRMRPRTPQLGLLEERRLGTLRCPCHLRLDVARPQSHRSLSEAHQQHRQGGLPSSRQWRLAWGMPFRIQPTAAFRP